MNLEIKLVTLFRLTVFISLSANINGDPPVEVDDIMKASETEPPFIHERAKYRVIMMLHGESQTNELGVVSGWFNVDLTAEGEKQARHVGANLKKLGYKFDVGHSSLITTASRTLELVLKEMDLSSIEKIQSWRLNIRHSGSLSGMKLTTMRKDFTKEQIDYWMHSYKTGPPPMPETHPQYQAITSDRRYIGNYGFVNFPTSESLEQALQRTIPYWETVIKPQIVENKRVIIVSHKPILRTLAYYLEGSKDETLLRFKLADAQPYIYEFDEHFNALICRQLIPVGLPLPRSDTSSQGF